MIDNPKVSVIIPVFNGELFLDRCLSSVINQPYNNIEVIIINDGSTDGTQNICESYAQNDSRVIIINKKNEGVSAARNVGLDAATGDYIYFVDADDYVLEDGIKSLVNKATKSAADLIVAEYYVTHETKKDRVSPVILKDSNDFLCSIISGKNHSALWNKLFKNKLFGGIRFLTDISYMEDKVIVSQILLVHQPKIEFLHSPVYVYWQDWQSATNSNDRRMLDIFVAGLYIEDNLNKLTNNNVKQAYASFVYKSIWFVLTSIKSQYLMQGIKKAQDFLKMNDKYHKKNLAPLKTRLLLLNLELPLPFAFATISSMRVVLNHLSSARRERKKLKD